MIKKDDLVTRNSYHNDILFRVIFIDNGIAKLKGENVRLIADSKLEDLKIYEGDDKENNKEFLDRLNFDINLDRQDYFYIPGKILHIDSDKEYLSKCLDFYKKLNLWAYGINLKEEDIYLNIIDYLNEYKPDIVVITGHDAYYKDKNKDDLTSYKNSLNFVKAVKKARVYETSHERLIIIAGACGSDYEELIKAGANFASSPKRINIHALDPAIIASMISLSDKRNDLDIIKILEKTKYGKYGMGGIITKGTMYVGYPR